jgi:signal transduction histidine kinase
MRWREIESSGLNWEWAGVPTVLPNPPFRVTFRNVVPGLLITAALGLILVFFVFRKGPKGAARPAVPDPAAENARLHQNLQRLTEELKQTQTQYLLESSKLTAIGDLAMNVAHEINNPLTSILGFTSLLMESLDQNDPRIKDLKIIEKETLRAREIVRNLLDIARKDPSRKDPTDVNALLRSATDLLRCRAHGLNIEIREELQAALPSIRMASDQMKLVFINLIQNAFDAMDRGGRLTLQTGLTDQTVEIRFTDNGRGIPQNELHKVFEPFYTTKNGSTAGLGLSVCYGVIERHGGRITVQSEPEKGTTFTLYLPVREALA